MEGGQGFDLWGKLQGKASRLKQLFDTLLNHRYPSRFLSWKIMFRNHAKYNILYPCFRWYPTWLNVWKEGRALSNEGNYGVKARRFYRKPPCWNHVMFWSCDVNREFWLVESADFFRWGVSFVNRMALAKNNIFGDPK